MPERKPVNTSLNAEERSAQIDRYQAELEAKAPGLATSPGGARFNAEQKLEVEMALGDLSDPSKGRSVFDRRYLVEDFNFRMRLYAGGAVGYEQGVMSMTDDPSPEIRQIIDTLKDDAYDVALRGDAHLDQRSRDLLGEGYEDYKAEHRAQEPKPARPLPRGGEELLAESERQQEPEFGA